MQTKKDDKPDIKKTDNSKALSADLAPNTAKKDDKPDIKKTDASKDLLADLPPNIASALRASKPADLAGVCALYQEVKDARERACQGPIGSPRELSYRKFCTRFSGRLASPAAWAKDELIYWKADFTRSVK
jgi:hypothetical protein